MPKGGPKDLPALDTRLLSRLIHGTGTDHTIEALAERLEVGMIGRHSRLGDAPMTVEIFVRLLDLRGPTILGQGLDALRRAHPGR